MVVEVGFALAGVAAAVSWLVAKIRKRKPSAHKKQVQVSSPSPAPSVAALAKVQAQRAATLVQKASERLGEVCRAVAEQVRRLSVRASARLLRASATVLDFGGLVLAGLHRLLCPVFKPALGESGPLPQANEPEWRRLPFQKLGAFRNKDTLVPSFVA